MNKKIAFYVRSATGNLVDLRRQRKTLKRFVKEKVDLTSRCVEIYQDTHQSGLHKGPEFERQDILDGKSKVVIVSRMTRIARCFDLLRAFDDLVRSKSVRFICVDEGFDSIPLDQDQVSGGGL